MAKKYTIDIEVEALGWQEDGWWCGYYCVYGLLSAELAKETPEAKVGQLIKTESIAHHKMPLGAEDVFWSILEKIDEIISSNYEVLAKFLCSIWHQERILYEKVRQFMDVRNEGALKTYTSHIREEIDSAGSSTTGRSTATAIVVDE